MNRRCLWRFPFFLPVGQATTEAPRHRLQAAEGSGAEGAGQGHPGVFPARPRQDGEKPREAAGSRGLRISFGRYMGILSREADRRFLCFKILKCVFLFSTSLGK